MKSCDNAFAIPNPDRSPLYDVRNPACASVKDDACEVLFLADDFDEASLSILDSIWWSQTGSNRRPHACKARALPAELWPRTRRRMLSLIKVVGLGRLELPTSRLSSARSNQLSYKPPTRGDVLARTGLTPDASRSPWRVFVREKRKTRTAKSRQCSSTILTTVGH